MELIQHYVQPFTLSDFPNYTKMFGQLGETYEFSILPKTLGTQENSWQTFSRIFEKTN